MKEPKELAHWDFPHTVPIPDGYDMRDIPDLTRDNFQVLIEEYNKLVEVVNLLCQKQCIIFEEDDNDTK